MNTLLLTGMILLQTMRLDPTDDVKAAMDRFSDAYVAADVAVLGSLLADPYLHVNGATGTVIDDQAWLAWVATQHDALESGALVIESYEIEDLLIRMRKDSSIVTGIVRSSGVRDGEPFRTAVRFTNLWVLEGKEWKRALFHDSAIPVDR